jgi:hypothetical protein
VVAVASALMAGAGSCAECRGKIVIVMYRPRKLRRMARNGRGPGRVKTIKGHDLCARCWQALLDRARRGGPR